MWKANQFVNISLWVLALISVVLCIWAFFGYGEATGVLGKLNTIIYPIDTIDPMLVWSYILAIIATVLIIIFMIYLPIGKRIFNYLEPKTGSVPAIIITIVALIVGTIIAFFALWGLGIILFAFASGSIDSRLILPGQTKPSEGTVKFADINLISVYIMLSAAILVTIGASVAKILKMR